MQKIIKSYYEQGRCVCAAREWGGGGSCKVFVVSVNRNINETSNLAIDSAKEMPVSGLHLSQRKQRKKSGKKRMCRGKCVKGRDRRGGGDNGGWII